MIKSLFLYGAVAAITGCASDAVVAPATGLSIVAVDKPSNPAVGDKATLRVRVDIDGKPAAGYAVVWSATAGAIAQYTVSDAEGLASVDWTMPKTPTYLSATAVVAAPEMGSVRSVVFYTVAVPGPPAHIFASSVSGSTSINSCHRVMAAHVLVTDRFENVLDWPEVSWSILDGPIEDAGPSLGSSYHTFRALRTIGDGHVRATIPKGDFVDFTLSVTPAVYQVLLIDEGPYGDKYFESAQNCGGYSAPQVDTIPVGAQATWINQMETSMQLVAVDGTNFPASPTVPPGQSYSMRIDVAGTYRYADANSPTVVGTLIVR